MQTKSLRSRAATGQGSGPATPLADVLRAAPRLPHWLQVVRTYHQCEGVLTDALKPLGLTLPQHELLVTLLGLPGQTQQQLASHVFVGKSHVSGLVTSMLAKRWIRREVDAHDARVRRVFLTARGADLASQSFALQAALIDAMFKPLSNADIALLSGQMHHISQALTAFAQADTVHPRTLRKAAVKVPSRPRPKIPR
jgi:DNA-binding MarR family transcriptional regulator